MKSGLSPQYILRASLCREPHCASGDWKRTALNIIENLDYAPSYAEPGYTQPERGVLFANWNYFPSSIDDTLERAGFSIEWEDEWTTCEDCGRAVRTSPDCYGWQPSYALIDDCQIVCADCLAKDPIEYLESLENHPTRALNMPAIDPAEYGYTIVEQGFENGFHPGQNDNPKEIYKRLHEKFPRLLFRVDDVGQFDIGFSIWTKQDEEEEVQP